MKADRMDKAWSQECPMFPWTPPTYHAQKVTDRKKVSTHDSLSFHCQAEDRTCILHLVLWEGL